MGAKITLALAARMPHRFRRIIVSGGVGENVFRPERVGMVADSMEHGSAMPFRNGSGTSPPWRLRPAMMYLPSPRACAGNRRPLTRDQVAAIEVPVLVAVGDLDPIAGDPRPPLVAALPNATMIRLPGIDHVGTPYARDFRSAAIEFLARDEETK